MLRPASRHAAARFGFSILSAALLTTAFPLRLPAATSQLGHGLGYGNYSGGDVPAQQVVQVPYGEALPSHLAARHSPRAHVPISAAPLRVMSTFFVTTTADTGGGSLRAAITAANSSPGLDQIHFLIVPGGLQSIAPTSPLPEITDPVIIDGTTQPGYAGTPLI